MTSTQQAANSGGWWAAIGGAVVAVLGVIGRLFGVRSQNRKTDAETEAVSVAAADEAVNLLRRELAAYARAAEDARSEAAIQANTHHREISELRRELEETKAMAQRAIDAEARCSRRLARLVAWLRESGHAPPADLLAD